MQTFREHIAVWDGGAMPGLLEKPGFTVCVVRSRFNVPIPPYR